MSGAVDSADVRAWSLASATGRMAIGLAMLAVPGRSLRALGFPDVSQGTIVVARIAGIRDLVLGGMTLRALGDREQLLRSSLANATADAGDAAAFALALRAGETDAGLRGLAAALPAAIAGIWAAQRLS